ncbi:MAG: hypothetical protein Q7U16_07635 [Agitococcus sp.]|nr:hypothetical protein [Agitococcus sp.]
MTYAFIEDKPHTEWTNEEANKVAKALLRLELERRELRKELADLKATMAYAASLEPSLPADPAMPNTLSDSAIVALAIRAGYGIVNANESPQTYEMRRAVLLVRSSFVENRLQAGKTAPLARDMAANYGGVEGATGEVSFPNWEALARYGADIANRVSGTGYVPAL